MFQDISAHCETQAIYLSSQITVCVSGGIVTNGSDGDSTEFKVVVFVADSDVEAAEAVKSSSRYTISAL